MWILSFFSLIYILILLEIKCKFYTKWYIIGVWRWQLSVASSCAHSSLYFILLLIDTEHKKGVAVDDI